MQSPYPWRPERAVSIHDHATTSIIIDSFDDHSTQVRSSSQAPGRQYFALRVRRAVMFRERTRLACWRTHPAFANFLKNVSAECRNQHAASVRSPIARATYGRGGGVGRGRGVPRNLGVGVGRTVGVGLAGAVAVGVDDGVAVAVAVSVAVAVAVELGVAVVVAVAVAVAVAVKLGVDVAVGVTVFVGVAVGVTVAVGVGVGPSATIRYSVPPE